MASKGGDEDIKSVSSETKQEEENTKQEREQPKQTTEQTPKQTTEQTNPDQGEQDDEDAGKFNTDHLLQEVSEKLLLHGSKECLEEAIDSGIINKTNINNETVDESNLETDHTRKEDGEVIIEKPNIVENKANENSASVNGESVEQQEKQDVETLPESTELSTNAGGNVESAVRLDTEINPESAELSTKVGGNVESDTKTKRVQHAESGNFESVKKAEQSEGKKTPESVEQLETVDNEPVEKSNQSKVDKLETVKLSTNDDVETVAQKDQTENETNEEPSNVDSLTQAETVGKTGHLKKTEGETANESENFQTKPAEKTDSVLHSNDDLVENRASQKSEGKSDSHTGQNLESLSDNENEFDIHQSQDCREAISNKPEPENKMDDNNLSQENVNSVNNNDAENASKENGMSYANPVSSDQRKPDDSYETPQEVKSDRTNDEDVLSERKTVQIDQSEGDEQQQRDIKNASEPERELTSDQDEADPANADYETKDSSKVDDDDQTRNDFTDTDNAYETEIRSESKDERRYSEDEDKEGEEHKEIPDETYEGIHDDYEQKSRRSYSSMSSRSTDDAKSAKDEKGKPFKQDQSQQSKKSVRMDENVQSNQPRTASTKPKGNTPSSPSPAQKHATRNSSRSAQPFSRPVHKPEATTKAVSYTSLRRPKTSNYGSMISRESNKKKDYFQEELRRLRVRLGKDAENIKKPQFKEHVPFVWTSLEPYYNTYVPNYLINLPDEELQPQRPVSRGRPSQGDDFHQGYTTRSTAIGLCDPWIDLRMDQSILPKLEQPKQGKDKPKAQKKKKDASQKAGSTRLPKFPVVDFNAKKENATRKFPYNEVAKFRTELKGRFSSNAQKKVDMDYQRTKDDFYRMDLHRLDEVHPLNRPHMRKTYFAYLQNTPGSRKAVKDCVKTLDTDESGPRQDTPLEEKQHQQAVASN
ncbi:glutamic acid-rich protein-like isoform X1 [Mizuhopecten yessoensis]|uniref:glutamic acid-rich protein-like isoform X1 n=1 Tax=Mizuhopecten yessoensis TaxID=6573 RepID=UPI000B45BB3C|nr:glutamic acid-rich protein-like isoform X1 [Mizuhopecten yessoensis]